ncbi:hypothetical protein J2067_004270 [Erwinia rhapontici]|nr:hypothetical protein [Erwinia rhapontici]
MPNLPFFGRLFSFFSPILRLSFWRSANCSTIFYSHNHKNDTNFLS